MEKEKERLELEINSVLNPDFGLDDNQLYERVFPEEAGAPYTDKMYF
ncbi:hypothetical protein [Radiobacillus deserti]|nr:hypothetical protein [Radiobacillus deserti]